MLKSYREISSSKYSISSLKQEQVCLDLVLMLSVLRCCHCMSVVDGVLLGPVAVFAFF